MFNNQLFAPQLFSRHLFPRANIVDSRTLNQTLPLTDNVSYVHVNYRLLTDTLLLIDTLSSIHGNTVDLSNTLTFTQTTDTTQSFYRSLTDTIPLTDSIVKSLIKNLTQTLSFTQTLSADRHITVETLTDTITFTTSLHTIHAGGLDQYPLDVIFFTEHLFTDLLTGGATQYVRSLSNTLTFTQTLSEKIVYNKLLTDTLGLFQTLDTPNHHGLFDNLVFTTTLTPKLKYNRHITDNLNFSQDLSGGGYKISEFTQTLTFTQTLYAKNQKIFGKQDYLNFTQTLSYDKYKYASLKDTLFFYDSLNNKQTYNTRIVDLLLFKAGGGYTTDYTTASTTLDNSNVIYSDIVPVVIKKYVTLSSDSSNILLPAPLFGDGQKNVASLSFNRMVDGTVRTLRKTTNRQKLTYRFELKRQKAYELQVFLDNNDLKYLNLENQKGEKWLVRITNNPIVFEATGRGYVCPNNAEVHQVELQFEGRILSGVASTC